MTVWTRASVVLAAVGVSLLALAAFAAAGPLRAGADFAALVPVYLGVGLKGVLALMAAAVMAWAASLEARRRTLEEARAARTPVVRGAAPAPERIPEAARQAAEPADHREAA